MISCYHTSKRFSENLSAIEMKKTKVKMNKPVYLSMSILDISKTLMYEFWYDYLKPEYKDKAKLCYMDIDSFAINIFTEDFRYEEALKILTMMLKDGLMHPTMMRMINNLFQSGCFKMN